MKRGLVVALSLFVVTVAHAAEPAELPRLPPLTEPATGRYISGKFIWADYFTSNVEAARSCYAALLGRDWKQISGERESRYRMFYQHGEAVAGMAYYAASPDRLNRDLTMLADPLGAPLGLVRWTYPQDAAEGSGSQLHIFWGRTNVVEKRQV